MAKRENKEETIKKPDVFIYYTAYLEDENGRTEPCGIHFRSKKAFFDACSEWLDQGRGITIYEDSIAFS